MPHDVSRIAKVIGRQDYSRGGGMIWPTSSDSSASRRSSGVLADSIYLSKDAAAECAGVGGKATTLGLSVGSIPLAAPIVVPVGRHGCDSECSELHTPPPPSCPARCSWRVAWPTHMPGSRSLRRHLVECCRYGQTIIWYWRRCPGRYRLVPRRLCRSLTSRVGGAGPRAWQRVESECLA
jgi:hypothetical protein